MVLNSKMRYVWSTVKALPGNFCSSGQKNVRQTPVPEVLPGDSRVFCMAPWMHMCVPPNGLVFPCCFFTWDAPVGDLHKQTLTEAWNSVGYRRIRLNMLAGRESQECGMCYELQRLGHFNLREWLNACFAHHFPLVAATQKDGTVEKLNLPYLDIRFSNRCNFRCRICSPQQSSAWYADGHLLGMLSHGQPQVLTPTRDFGELWRQLEPLLPGFEKIYFAGGEPLMQEEHYRLLNLLIAKKMFSVQLVYNTNFSVMSYKGQDVMPLWDKFKSVRICASLDAMGRRGEYLRKGQDWEQVVRNRERMSELCPRAKLDVHCALNVMNALHLPDFHKEWIEKGYIEPDDMYLNILFGPEEYRIQVLPQHLKELVADKYFNHIASVSGLSEHKKADFRAAVGFMRAQDQSGLLGKFRQRTRELDKIRGESFAEVFPELSELMEGI